MHRVLLCFGLLLLIVGDANALSYDALDNIEELLKAKTDEWHPALTTYAQRLLYMLAGISIAWQMILMVLKTPDIQEFMTEVIRIVMFTGFFLAVIQYSSDWAAYIVNGFTQASIDASGTLKPINPGNTLKSGVDVAWQMLDHGGFLESVAMALLCVPVLICFAAIAAFQLMVLAEMYIITAAGVLLLGFGGSSWTMEYAKRYIQYTVSVAAKLFTLYLILALADDLLNEILGFDKSGSIQDAMTILGLVFILFMLVASIPGMVQGIINGSSIGTAGAAITGLTVAVTKAVGVGLIAAGKTGVSKGLIGGMKGVSNLQNQASNSIMSNLSSLASKMKGINQAKHKATGSGGDVGPGG